MIRLNSILTPGRSIVNAQGGSKKRVLELIAQLICRDLPELDELALYESLIAREKLGSTGFGNGIAIPHCRFPGCETPISAVLRLERPIDFDALDGEPVDLLFVLLAPEEATDAHLELLRQVASILDNSQMRAQLRQADSNQALYQLIVDAQASST